MVAGRGALSDPFCPVRTRALSLYIYIVFINRNPLKTFGCLTAVFFNAKDSAADAAGNVGGLQSGKAGGVCPKVGRLKTEGLKKF